MGEEEDDREFEDVMAEEGEDVIDRDEFGDEDDDMLDVRLFSLLG